MNDKKHGRGVEIYTDGTEYNGDFKYDEKHGHGILKFADGSWYEGDFFENLIQG